MVSRTVPLIWSTGGRWVLIRTKTYHTTTMALPTPPYPQPLTTAIVIHPSTTAPTTRCLLTATMTTNTVTTATTPLLATHTWTIPMECRSTRLTCCQTRFRTGLRRRVQAAREVITIIRSITRSQGRRGHWCRVRVQCVPPVVEKPAADHAQQSWWNGTLSETCE